MIIAAMINAETQKKLINLAERRFGSREQSAQNQLVQDIIQYKLGRWEKYGCPWGEWFYLQLGLHGVLLIVKSWGWGRIITSYFQE